MPLPEDIDATYADSGSDASVKLHQQHHDEIHAAINALPSTYVQQAWIAPGVSIAVAYVHREDPTPILKYAVSRGFDFITYTELAEAIYDGKPLPPKPFLLSVDDEPVEMMTIHDPALALYGAKATLFVSSGYPDGEVMDGGTDTYFTLGTSATWAQLRTLRDTGRWDFQNHTRTHRSMTLLTTQERTDEWTYSQARILAELGVTPRCFQHPKDQQNLTTIAEAKAFGFEVVGVGPKGVTNLNSSYGPVDRFAPPLRQGHGVGMKGIVWRADPAQLDNIESVFEPYGNRIPDTPMDDNTLGQWTVTAGTEGSATDGVRFDQPDKSGTIDLRSNATGDVTAITTRYIAMKPGEVVAVAYYRQCGVTGGTYRVRLKQYDFKRTHLRDLDLESLTGTVALDEFEQMWAVPTDCAYVKIELTITGAPSGSFATCQLPFLGAIR